MYWILLASSGANFCCTKVDAAWAKNSNLSVNKNHLLSRIPSLGVIKTTSKPNQEPFLHIAPDVVSEELQAPFSWIENYPLWTVQNTPTPSPPTVSPPELTPAPTPPSPELTPTPPPPNLTIPSPPSPALTPTPPPALPPQQYPVLPTESPTNNIQQEIEPPQLEGQPTDFFKPTPVQIKPSLDAPEINRVQRIERLLLRLQEKKQTSQESNSYGELGRLLVRESAEQSDNNDLGTLRLQEKPLEQIPPPSPPSPTTESKPIGYLLANVGYFHTSNIFSSDIPIQDGLIYSGLTLASAGLPIGANTFINGSIDGNVIRYIDQSQYNYNQIRFNLSVYQQFTRQMYGEIGWSNQQFFYATNNSFAQAGDRFLNENSFRLSLGRRDILNSRMTLDSFYEFRFSLTAPPSQQDSRDRLINSLWVSLNYYLRKSLQIGLDYQFGLSNFTQRFREDQYHRIFAHLNYKITPYTNLSLQGGVTTGSSTDAKIDFDGWFFTVNYNLELGRF